MAIIDQERGVIVVRIVYDGPPFSGKTTSVQALNKILGKTSALFSPGESAGRTFYFDWMEYVGGYFKGYGISCQIVSVPGQLSVQERRHFLLDSADVVVFVIDSSEEESHIALSYFKDLQPFLTRTDEAVRVIIQANKQDKERVLTAEQIKPLFAENAEVKVVESTATLGKGVRETFVLAVRLAIERSSALLSKGQLPIGKPEINSGEELFALLQQQSAMVTPVTSPPEESESAVETTEQLAQLDELFIEDVVESSSEVALDAEAGQTTQTLIELEQLFESDEQIAEKVQDASALSDAEIEDEVVIAPKKGRRTPTKKLPKLPDEEVSVHWTWPPLMGQEILQELFKHALRPRLQADGTWLIEVQNEWRCFSKQDWCYPDAKQARQALRLQISRHLQNSLMLSQPRCIAVASETEEGWRLWQIIRADKGDIIE